MATSPEAFRQVKNILQKLDQSIDAARDRRLTSKPRAGSTGSPATPGSASSPNGAGVNGAHGSANGAKPQPDNTVNRAKPLPPRQDPNRGFIRPGGPSQH